MERGHVADNEMALQWIADRDRAVSKAKDAAIDKSLVPSKVGISTSVAFQLNPENGCDSVSV
jgi:hypothetical protein